MKGSTNQPLLQSSASTHTQQSLLYTPTSANPRQQQQFSMLYGVNTQMGGHARNNYQQILSTLQTNQSVLNHHNQISTVNQQFLLAKEESAKRQSTSQLATAAKILKNQVETIPRQLASSDPNEYKFAVLLKSILIISIYEQKDLISVQYIPRKRNAHQTILNTTRQAINESRVVLGAGRRAQIMAAAQDNQEVNQLSDFIEDNSSLNTK